MKTSLLFPIAWILTLLFLGWRAQPWAFSAKLFPTSLVSIGVVLLTFYVVRELWKSSAAPSGATEKEQSMDVGMAEGEEPAVIRRRSFEIWAWLIGFLLSILTIGMLISLPLFSFLYLRVHAREKWWVCILLPLLVAAFMYGLFDMVLHTPWIVGWLWELLLPDWFG